MNIDLRMTLDERLDRIEYLLPALARREEVSLAKAKEAFDLIKANRSLIRDINIRTMVMTLRVRKTSKIGDWANLAKFQLTHN